MTVFKEYSAPPVSESELLRYAGAPNSAEMLNEIAPILKEAEPVLNYKLCYCKLKLTKTGDICDFGDFCVASRALSRELSECREAVLFLASVGHGIDRLISKYSRLSPARALLLDALGSERVEALCDSFCHDAEAEYGKITRRFSPGYGDLPLDTQRDIFRVLSPERSMGVYLSENLLMSPSKSVTAFFGIK